MKRRIKMFGGNEMVKIEHDGTLEEEAIDYVAEWLRGNDALLMRDSLWL